VGKPAAYSVINPPWIVPGKGGKNLRKTRKFNILRGVIFFFQKEKKTPDSRAASGKKGGGDFHDRRINEKKKGGKESPS